MQSYRKTNVVAGTYLTPHEVQQEFREFIGAMNAIAEDNMDEEELLAAQYGVDSFGRLFDEVERSTSRLVTIDTSNEYGDILPIPDDDGDPWVVEVTTGDCILEGYLGQVINASGSAPNCWIAVMVDGVLVGKSPTMLFGQFTASLSVEWSVPVGSGTHRIEAVFSPVGKPAASDDVEFLEGNMVFREAAR
jgi:hypothetical protein